VEHLEKTVDVVLPIGRPLIPIGRKKANVPEKGAAIFRRRALCGLLRSDFSRNVIEEAFEERTELPICRCPVPAGVRFDSLVEVAEGRGELELLQKLVDFVIGLRELDFFGEERPEGRGCVRSRPRQGRTRLGPHPVRRRSAKDGLTRVAQVELLGG
jgi:hypothetical protein